MNKHLMDETQFLKLSTEEADIACEAIAGKLIQAKCECDFNVGYTCHRCRRLGEDLCQRNLELAWRYGQLLKRERTMIDKPFTDAERKREEEFEAAKDRFLDDEYKNNSTAHDTGYVAMLRPESVYIIKSQQWCDDVRIMLDYFLHR